MSRPKKRTKNGRLTREAVEIVLEMLKEGGIQGKLRQAEGCELDPEFYRDYADERYPYRVGDLWYTETLTYYSSREDPRDIVGFDNKADRKEFKRRWRERYPKDVKPETQVEAKSESEIKLTYPLFAKSRGNGAIILFTSVETGVCVKAGGNTPYERWADAWVDVDDTDHWQHLTFAEAQVEIFGENHD